MALYVILAILFTVLLNFVVAPYLTEVRTQEVEYSEFIAQVNNKAVEQVDYNLNSDELKYKLADDNKMYKTVAWPHDEALLEKLKADGVKLSIERQTSSGWSYLFFTLFVPVLLLIGLGWLINRKFKQSLDQMDSSPGFGFGGGFGPMGFGKSGARIVAQSETGVTFKDVAGQEEAKEQLFEIVDILHSPRRYERIGAKLPKGALLVGPPGTGKTLMAKAVAGEAGVPFFSISGSEFVEMLAGRGAAKVRDLFSNASKKAPCIIFIDEIDTIGKKRDTSGMVSNDEREQTLNQLLAEMDGFSNSKGIVVLGATNRPESLDPALLRPGRFDRRIPVELPDLNGRLEILKLHAATVKTKEPIDLEVIARSTSGASGADLANIVNEAALRAVRLNRQLVVQEDLQESVETVIAGQQKKNHVMDAEEKKIVAYHEIGHALVAAKLSHKSPVTKITIVPRTSGALGYTMQVDEAEKYLQSKQDLLDKISVLCAGRAAEHVVFGSVTTGAANDIQQATKIARAMISQYGMDEQIGMVALGNVRNRYLNGEAIMDCSDGMAERVDNLTIELINSAFNAAVQILKENKFKLHELAAYLLRKETITGEEFMNILTRDEQRFKQAAEESQDHS